MSRMAVLSFAASYQTPLPEMAKLLTGLDDKGWNEVIRTLDAIQVWREWFAARYGELKVLRHRSNPDDPPDLDLIFENGQIGLEHTALMPYPLGHAKAIAKEVNPAGGRSLPSLSRQWTRKELEDLALGMPGSAPWANVDDEHNAAFAALISTLRRKLHEPASQVVCVTDEATFGSADTEWLASGLYDILSTNEFQHFGDRTVVLLNRTNHIQFFSALVRRGEPLQAKRDGKPVVPRAQLRYE
jgi:hypothetical protein